MRRVAAGILLSLALAGCTNQAHVAASPSPTVAGSSAPAGGSTSQATALNAILAGIDGVMGDLQRILVRDRKVTPEVTERLRSIYAGPELLNQIDAFSSDVKNGLVGYRPVPGNRVSKVSRLITVSSICVFMEVTRDYSPTAVEPRPPARLYVVLITKENGDDPKGLNPTPWTMIYDGVQQDGSQPQDLCR